MDTHLTLTILSLVSTALFFHLHVVVAIATPHNIAPSPSNVAATNLFFIRNSCRTTLYPELCFKSLYRYAEYIQEDPALLARAAVGVSLNRAKRMANYVSNLSRKADDEVTEPRVASALRDCFSVFSDAVEQIRDSLQQMFLLDGKGESLRFQLSNVQTYMSAALTNEDTCTDGFEEISEGPMKKNVCVRSEKVMQLTSNALALVNNYVSKVTNYDVEP
ncbi:PMEI domain-containing protein [Heracleum sosnowskyi]|uniref:PMEI domain-containing protein n=1 Tax=Heracleum sosnowskyi TaxID=360622 RepID=A0AAD8IJH2_9APIA|nr:PMEI domain-containing protein [Heracleum sosnowskyi]